jgi:hypothetical protein
MAESGSTAGEARLDIKDGAPVHVSPLSEHGIYFNTAMREWRLIKCSTSKELADVTTVARSDIAALCIATLPAVEAWEEALLKTSPTLSVFELLDVKEDGTVYHLQPLVAWRFAYYPASRLWRFTRSHRDEAPIAKVAKRVGVSVALIRTWEDARARTPD